MNGRLIRMENGATVEEYAIQGNRITIGRELGNMVQLSHPKVSKQHALIHLGALSTIEDLDSSNGTTVNGEPISGTRKLNDGDRIRFGSVECKFYYGAGSSVVLPIDDSEESIAMTMMGTVPREVKEPEQKRKRSWFKRK